jgi:hypothetical protein
VYSYALQSVFSQDVDGQAPVMATEEWMETLVACAHIDRDEDSCV